MSSILREHRQKLRKKYGVQFILDALRTHYRLGWWVQVDVRGPAQQKLLWGQDDMLPQLTCLYSLILPHWLCLLDLPAHSGSAPLRQMTCVRYRLLFWVWCVSSWSGTSLWMTCRSY